MYEESETEIGTLSTSSQQGYQEVKVSHVVFIAECNQLIVAKHRKSVPHSKNVITSIICDLSKDTS